MLVKFVVVAALAAMAYAIFIMIADARDPYGTPDPDPADDPAL